MAKLFCIASAFIAFTGITLARPVEIVDLDAQKGPGLPYPTTARDESVVETKFGVTIANPYRFLDDSDNIETQSFVDKQKNLANSLLSATELREKINNLFKQGLKYPRRKDYTKRGNKYFFVGTDGNSNAKFYFQESLNGEEREFLDPISSGADGSVALKFGVFSYNGDYYAYFLETRNQPQGEIRVRDVATGKDLEDRLVNIRHTTIQWTPDNKGFFYATYPEANDDLLNHSIYYHTLGSPQSEDVLKVNFPANPSWRMGFYISQCGNYLFVIPSSSVDNTDWWFADLRKFAYGDKLVLSPTYVNENSDNQDAGIAYIVNKENIVYIKTNLFAPNERVVKVDLNNPRSENWVTVIPEMKDGVIDWAEAHQVGDKLYAVVKVTRKVVDYLEIYDLESGELLKKLDLPLGSITKYPGFVGDNEMFFRHESFSTSGTTYRFDLSNLENELEVVFENKPNGVDPNDFEVKQVFYKSKDQTEVPMFIVSKKGLELNGQNPTLLDTFGGFGYKETPKFDIRNIIWLKNFNGVLAVASIRGGSDLGTGWHESGKLLKKQNTFDDFNAAAEYLIGQKYTNRDKLASIAVTNGGLTIAAAANQRPELYGAMVGYAALLDMFTLPQITVNDLWRHEFGNPNKEEYFKLIAKYSPYQNVPENVDHYPATMLILNSLNNAIPASGSYKFIAQLQHNLGSELPDTPFILRPELEDYDEDGDALTFLYQTLHLESDFHAGN